MKRIPSFFTLGLGVTVVCGCTSPPKPTKKLASATPSPTAKNIKFTRQFHVRDIQFSSDNSRFAAVTRIGMDDKIEVWDARARRKISSWHYISQVPRAIGFLDANRLAVHSLAVNDIESLQIWNIRAAKVEKSLTLRGELLIVSPKRDLLATEAEIWRVRDWKKIANIHKRGFDKIRAAAMSPDGTILVTAAWDTSRGIEGFDVRTGRSLWLANGDQQGNVAFSPDGRSVGISTTVGIVLLNPKTGRVIRRIGHSYGGEFRFLSNQILVQKNVNRSRTYQESRMTYAVSTGKTLTTTPVLENEILTPAGLPRLSFVGANKSVHFE